MNNSTSDIEHLLTSETVSMIDRAITSKLGWQLYDEDIPVLAGIAKSEIDCSVFSVNQIEEFMGSNKNVVIDFGINFQEGQASGTLSLGSSVSYTIFVMYLKSRESELLDYIKCRRMPTPKKVMEKLLRLKKNIR